MISDQGQSLSDVFIMYAELPARMVATLSEPGPYRAYSKDGRWQLYTLLGDVDAQLYRQITFSFPLKKKKEKKRNESKSNGLSVCLVQPALESVRLWHSTHPRKGFPDRSMSGRKVVFKFLQLGLRFSLCQPREPVAGHVSGRPADGT